MNIKSKKQAFFLAVGDIVVLYLALFGALIVRYFGIPQSDVIHIHILPFSLLFIFCLFVFFIFGLYEKQIFIDKKKVLPVIIQAQIINALAAIIFFYFSPLTQITPKTNLFIYLIVSIFFLALWRIFAIRIISKKQIPICLIAQGEDVLFLKNDLEKNLRGFEIIKFIDLSNTPENLEDQIESLKNTNIEYIVLDSKDEAVSSYLPSLYNLVFSGISFFEVSDLYEALYGRVPLQIITHGWFLQYVKSKPHEMYDFFKRVMDIFVSFVIFIPSLLIYPLIFILIKIEDKGPIIYRDLRVGKNNKIITLLKFRSMTVGIVPELGHKVETRLGKFMRKTRIDELPQLINVLRGDISLIGPRPEQPKMVEQYNVNVSFYNIRHLIKPGLSGWAQIYHDNHPHHDIDIEATKEKLSYDLYYVKNRSVILDIIIVLKTIKTLLLSKGK